jgi:hypothetical protein
MRSGMEVVQNQNKLGNEVEMRRQRKATTNLFVTMKSVKENNPLPSGTKFLWFSRYAI